MARLAGARRLPGQGRRPPRDRPSHRLTHAADAPRHRAHDVEREVRHLVDHEAEFALIDQRELARFLDTGGRATGRAVDHGHEPDRLVRPADLDHLVADHHLEHAGLHDIHAGARVALRKHDAARGIGHARPGALGKHAHVDLVAIHCYLAVPGLASGDTSYARIPRGCASFHPAGGSTILGQLRQCDTPDPRPNEAGGYAMLRTGGLAIALLAGLWPGPTGSARADEWPSRPVKIVVAYAPGGSTDQFGRLMAVELSAVFRQQFFVENRPG